MIWWWPMIPDIMCSAFKFITSYKFYHLHSAETCNHHKSCSGIVCLIFRALLMSLFTFRIQITSKVYWYILTAHTMSYRNNFCNSKWYMRFVFLKYEYLNSLASSRSFFISIYYHFTWQLHVVLLIIHLYLISVDIYFYFHRLGGLNK